jgi:general stress protein 26
MTVREKAERLYKCVNTFILTGVGEDGYPMTKAVVPGKYRDSLDELFFCTNTSSNFTAAIARDGKASVYFFSRMLFWKGCMLKGEMRIVTDMAVKKKYWQDKFRNAYPEKSFTDPDFCVLRFVPTSGRYYSMYHVEDFAI